MSIRLRIVFPTNSSVPPAWPVRAAQRPPRFEAPLYGTRIRAGFPSPADDYVERTLDLNDLLVRNRVATFFLRVSGDSMTRAGIADGDVLVVDRSIEPRSGQIVVAAVDGEFTVKRYWRDARGAVELRPESDSPAYRTITLAEGQELSIFGVVTGCIRQFGT